MYIYIHVYIYIYIHIYIYMPGRIWWAKGFTIKVSVRFNVFWHFLIVWINSSEYYK